MQIANFPFIRQADGTVALSLAPPTAIGGWDIEFTMDVGSSGAGVVQVIKSVASGFNGQSGITITNSGNATMNISLLAGDTSGLEQGNYSARTWRLTSGLRTKLTEGYVSLM